MFIGKISNIISPIRLNNIKNMNYPGINSKMNNPPLLERIGFHSIKHSCIYNKDLTSQWKLRNTPSKVAQLSNVHLVAWFSRCCDSTKCRNFLIKLIVVLIVNIVRSASFSSLMDIRTNSTSSNASFNTMGNLSVFVEDGLRVITLDRPKKKNAITQEMYRDIPLALKEAADDDSTVITVLTGKGDYYTSGNDLTSFAEYQGTDIEKSAHEASILLRTFVSSFIEFPKILVAVVNGPAIGIGVTTLALCDAVYASDRASFHTPFTALGQSAEGCSTYTFPKIMGMSKASELLYFNRKITAHEAKDWGLVSKVFPHETFQEEVFTWLRSLTKLPVKSLTYTKAISRQWDIDDLRKANEMECERLKERWVSEDCMNAVIGFLTRRSKM